MLQLDPCLSPAGYCMFKVVVNFEHISHVVLNVSIVNFEHVNADGVAILVQTLIVLGFLSS